MRWLARLGAAAEILVSGLPAESRPARLPKYNPMRTAAGEAARTEAAMTLLDEDCVGFLMLTVHKDPTGESGFIRMHDCLDPDTWPAVGKMCDRIGLAERAQV